MNRKVHEAELSKDAWELDLVCRDISEIAFGVFKKAAKDFAIDNSRDSFFGKIGKIYSTFVFSRRIKREKAHHGSRENSSFEDERKHIEIGGFSINENDRL